VSCHAMVLPAAVLQSTAKGRSWMRALTGLAAACPLGCSAQRLIHMCEKKNLVVVPLFETILPIQQPINHKLVARAVESPTHDMLKLMVDTGLARAFDAVRYPDVSGVAEITCV
jgi:hypothetical protein